jgi:ADP-heptose:LPS heptosyltransferase
VTVRTNNHRGEERVLVIHPGALGDVLLARPVLHALRGRFPRAEMALLSTSTVGSLLCSSGEVDRTFPLEETYLTQLFAGAGSLAHMFGAWLGRCATAVGWLRDAGSTVTQTLRAAGVERITLQSPFSNDLVACHQADRYFEAIGMVGSRHDFTRPLILPDDLLDLGEKSLQAWSWNGESQLVLIHPGSGSRLKCVEAWRLATLIGWFIEANMTPMLLEGPADGQTVAEVLSLLPAPVAVIRDLDVSAMAGVLTKASLYLGHDSGLTHLAAALAIPTVACFGPTPASRWAPLGSTVSVVSGTRCVCSEWSEVETCCERACLQIPLECLIDTCRNQLAKRS